ncbi:MAG: HEPN domain-containing protein [Armatimonadota bacterium]|nr:HEPN domain-containing protein [Armatimonadota bacterium]
MTAEGLRGTQGRFVPRHVCWLAQQAAEKALKAALILEGVDFPFRHDLDALRNLLPEGWSVKDEHPDLTELTEWAVEARATRATGRSPR